jgi:regulator of RNase E activity RraA
MNRCRIHPAVPHPPADKLEALRALPSTIVSDQLERYGYVRGVDQITGHELGILAGPALTVRTRPGDNLIIYKAIEVAEPGDILVIEAGGVTDRAVMGEIVCYHAQAMGIAGLVIDGCIRDGAEIAAGTLPVFAKGFAHPGPFKSGPGELRGPVAVGGTVVRNGDLVVGDADGVAVVPVERLDEVIAGGQKALAREEEAIRVAKAGQMDTSWLDEQLEVEYVDGATAPARPERDGDDQGEVLYPKLS